MLTLSAILEKSFSYTIYTPAIQLIDSDDYALVAKDLLKTKPDVIGFSTWCISYPATLLIAKAVKRLRPEIPILFGGPQASIVARETLLNFPFVDFILSGEADLSFPQLLAELEKQNPDLSTIPGLFYRNKNGTILSNKSEPPIADLNKLPMPAYHHFPEKATVKLDVGRGCPFKCTYCTTNEFFSQKYRTKSVDRIIEEMLFVYEQLQVINFGFAHDMLTMNKKFVFELCDKLIEIQNSGGIHFKWSCSARTDCVSEEMLVKMKAAGCQNIFFGIESGSVLIQKKIKKNLNVEKAFTIADISRKTGLNMYASFIFGFPEETESDIEDSLKAILKLAQKGAHVQSSNLALLPGTPLFKKHHRELKLDGNFSNFSYAVCGHDELKLITQYPSIFSSFYYLPVQTLAREEMVYLNALINCMGKFRNTLFLLSPVLQVDSSPYKLLELFRAEFDYAKRKNLISNSALSQLIRIIAAFIHHFENKLNIPYLIDVFNFEAVMAVLLTSHANWQINHRKCSYQAKNSNFKIVPTPVWRTLQTSYKLESAIPSINGWEENKRKVRKGIYRYLIVATSPVKCKKIKIGKQEKYLLDHLSKLYFSDYVKKVKSIASEKEVLSWIKRMRRLGVLELSPG